MGRSILISTGNINDAKEAESIGFAYQTAIFECIVEGTRVNFPDDEQQCLGQCFEDLDELGMDYLCLYEVDGHCYSLFVHAAGKGLQDLKETGDVAVDRLVTKDFVSAVIQDWEQLMVELQRDPRYLQES
jgi:hypothetical protein